MTTTLPSFFSTLFSIFVFTTDSFTSRYISMFTTSTGSVVALLLESNCNSASIMPGW